MIVGHSQGGIQAVKVLYELAGVFHEQLPVWNPLTGKEEDRYTIIDPMTGLERSVVGLRVSYTTAVEQVDSRVSFPISGYGRKASQHSRYDGGVHRFCHRYGPARRRSPRIWTCEFIQPNGIAKVRTVRLPLGYNHVTVPVTSHLAAVRRFAIGSTGMFRQRSPRWMSNSIKQRQHPLAAEVWHSIKKHWVLELQQLIRQNIKWIGMDKSLSLRLGIVFWSAVIYWVGVLLQTYHIRRRIGRSPTSDHMVKGKTLWVDGFSSSQDGPDSLSSLNHRELFLFPDRPLSQPPRSEGRNSSYRGGYLELSGLMQRLEIHGGGNQKKRENEPHHTRALPVRGHPIYLFQIIS